MSSVKQVFKTFFLACVLLKLNYMNFATSSFNIAELNTLSYAIEITNKPVLIGQIEGNEETLLTMANKFGQKYQCSLPEVLPLPTDEVSNEENASQIDLDIASLLQPMETAPCLIKTKNWWTYEFCYGTVIKQYHLEDGKISGQVLILGSFDSDYKWTEDSENSKNRLQRFHSQFYVNGTKCDLNGGSRETEVRFHCEEGTGDYIRQVDEPQSCSYILTIHTSRLCHHPYLRLPPSNKPQHITCHPVLSAQDYDKYQHQQQVKAQREEEMRQKLLKEKQDTLVRSKESETESDGEDGQANVEVTDMGQEEGSDSSTVTRPSVEILNVDDVSEQEVDELGLSDERQEQLTSIKSTIQQKLQAELNAALDDKPNKEVAIDDVESTEEAAMERLAKTLKILLDRLDKVEEEAEQSLQQAKKKLGITHSTPEENLAGADEEEDGEESPESFLSDKTTDDEDAAESGGEVGETDSLPKVGVDVDDSDRIKVRVSKISPKKPRLRHEADEDKASQRLEETIRQKLEQAGLDTGGRKIEVRVISSRYADKNTQSLTDQETKDFQNMLLSLFNPESDKEVERHKAMADNYAFSFTEKNDEGSHDEREDDVTDQPREE